MWKTCPINVPSIAACIERAQMGVVNIEVNVAEHNGPNRTGPYLPRSPIMEGRDFIHTFRLFKSKFIDQNTVILYLCQWLPFANAKVWIGLKKSVCMNRYGPFWSDKYFFMWKKELEVHFEILAQRTCPWWYHDN